MSKAGTKKGAEKTKPPASQTPVIAHEIVPGKFTDNDCKPPWSDQCITGLWNQMVDRDGSDEFVLEIMDDLMDMTMNTIFNKCIDKQLLPFTITQARDAIVEIIEWQFLTQDVGETTIQEDLGWTEDEEPEPATTDCWAQGSVPCNTILATVVEVPEEEVVVPTVEETIPEEEVTAEVKTNEPEELADVVSDTDETPAADAKIKKKLSKKTPGPPVEPPTKSTSANRIAKFKPYSGEKALTQKGKLKSAGVSKMTESLEEREMKMIYAEVAQSMPQMEDKPSTLLNMPASCTSILKVQTGRPPGNKDVMYDEMGNVVAVMRLDPERLPTHKVNVQYHVVDPAVEAAQARLDAMRKGKSTGKVNRKSIPIKALSQESLNKGSKVKQATTGPTVAPLPPPLSSRKSSKAGLGKKTKNVSIKSKTKYESDQSANNMMSSRTEPHGALRHVILERNAKYESDQSFNCVKSQRIVKANSAQRSPYVKSIQHPKAKLDRNLNHVKAPDTNQKEIDEMEVAHGVVIRESGRVKKGPGRYYRKHDVLEENQKGMKPLTVRVQQARIGVGDLLDRHTPILRPLGESSPLPLPPIVPMPSQSNFQQV